MARKNNGLAEFIAGQSLLDTPPICPHCELPVSREDMDAFGGYWGWSKFVVHKQCKLKAQQRHTDGCRLIDENCNDCEHFRGIRFEGDGKHNRKRIGTCNAGKVSGEFPVYPGDPMHMPCFELRERKQ